MAEQLIVYPAKGQTAEQQASDEAACYGWARQSTGIDPVAVAEAPAPPPAEGGPAIGGGERLGGALRGAAGGAIIGEIAGDDAGEGAAVGAVAGTMLGGARARKQHAAEQQHQQQQAQAGKEQQFATYNRAYSACLEGRGYTVK
tara:strand:+ start:3284 stop:3715 length:432 start_codon:yes stop_codon:yes gene_type:complete